MHETTAYACLATWQCAMHDLKVYNCIQHTTYMCVCTAALWPSTTCGTLIAFYTVASSTVCINVRFLKEEYSWCRKSDQWTYRVWRKVFPTEIACKHYIEAKIANTEAIVKYNMCVCVYCTPQMHAAIYACIIIWHKRDACSNWTVLPFSLPHACVGATSTLAQCMLATASRLCMLTLHGLCCFRTFSNACSFQVSCCYAHLNCWEWV